MSFPLRPLFSPMHRFHSNVLGRVFYTAVSVDLMGIHAKTPRGMPETTDVTKPYVCRAFFYTYIPMIRFNL